MVYLLFFFFGASIGSFVQVVVTRLNVAPLMGSRSKCLSCGEALRIPDLIPVLSYIFLKGKCRYCRIPYGKQALAVEIAFGILFVLLYHFFLVGLPVLTGALWLAYYTLLFVSLGTIALYDMRHSYIPVFFLALFVTLSVFMQVVRYMHDPTPAVLLAPLVVGLPFLLVWLVTKGRAVGFGDVVLFFAIGSFFGIEQGLATLLISAWVGSIVGMFTHLRHRKERRATTAIPFVPYIVIAFLIVLFTDLDIFSIASLFS